MNDFIFERQRKTFISYGYALEPTSGTDKVIGNKEKYEMMKGADIYDKIPADRKVKKSRVEKGDAGDVNGFKGPWAGFKGENLNSVGPSQAEITASAMRKALVTQVDYGLFEPGAEKSIFHGKEEIDEHGKTYMSPPTDVDVRFDYEGEVENFLPKKLVNTLTGHSKAVSKVLFFPKTGHLLLSGSMDGRTKIWDVYHGQTALRTFIGHNKGVKDICFNVDGTKFISSSYDKYVKIWDTETGKCLQSYALSTVAHCVTFNPEPGKQNLFLAGCADNKIKQYDINAGVITMDYHSHQGTVNQIVFMADEKRFISSSDDKTLRVWEFGSTNVLKYIAEEDLASMPSILLHPNKKRILCQSLDNQIMVYSAQDRYKKHRKKFLGHQVSGFNCQIGCSPDGKFIMSGDASGNLWFWDWKSARILRKFQAHDMILNSCAWHPIEPSKIATCSWDSTIKIWQ